MITDEMVEKAKSAPIVDLVRRRLSDYFMPENPSSDDEYRADQMADEEITQVIRAVLASVLQLIVEGVRAEIPEIQEVAKRMRVMRVQGLEEAVEVLGAARHKCSEITKAETAIRARIRSLSPPHNIPTEKEGK